MALTPGTRLGVYDITAPIGEGGMGQVYRATDTTLGRQVAIKILPDAFASDTDRLNRFEREAKTLAALNHPHIAAIYGFEKSSGIHALVMELVEGEDLSQRIARGPIPLDEALPIARQIADALEAAHEQGIIHRDLKPANIKVRSDGTVKVLDFGLAKAMDPTAGSSPSISLSPTLTSPAMMTGAGLILGTAAYMAPEQAKGRAVDKRADIWAFGVVLYEMLTGRRLFDAEDMSETLAAVLTRDVSLTTLPEAIPARVRAVMRECLVRDPRQRLRDIGDARIALERTIAGVPDATSAPTPVASPFATAGQRWLVGTAAAALVVALGIGLWAPWRHAAREPELRLTAEIGATASLVNAGFANSGTAAIFSPDATLLAFVARKTVGEPSQLYVRRLDQLTATPLPGTGDATSPFFSPDGQWIAFFAGGKLKKISVAGGTPFTVCDAPNSRGGDWAEDGNIVFQPTSGAGAFLMHVASTGGTPERLTTLEPGEQTQRWPQILPGSRGLIYTSSNTIGSYGDAIIAFQPLPQGPRKVLIKGGYFGRYVPSGHLLYVHEGVVVAAPFDLARLEVTGPSVPVLEDVGLGVSNGSAQFAASSAGTLAYVTRQSSLTSIAAPIVWLDRHGKTTPMRTTLGDWSNVQFSPDGQRLALDINDGRQTDVWVYDWARDAMTRLTLDPGEHWMPVWTPDGRHIAFKWGQSGGAPNLFWRRSDGGGDIQRLTTASASHYTGSWHPSARTLAFTVATITGSDLMLLPMDGSEASGWRPGSPTTFLTGHTDAAPAFSPDGRWMAYHSNESGPNQVYVQPFPGPGGKWLISTDGGTFPVWSRARQELLYAGADNRIMTVSYTATGDSFTASKPQAWADTQFLPRNRGFGNAGRPFDLHPDGERVVMAPVPENERFGRQDKLVFVFNFFDELRRLAPVTRQRVSPD